MQLTQVQSRDLLQKHGVYVTEACDKCGKILGPVRFTRAGQAGEWCSKRCRDGFERKPGACLGCGVSLNGKRKGAVFCSDVCRKRWRIEIYRIIAETPIEKSALSDAILASRWGYSLKLGKSSSEAVIAKSVTPTLE
jgi:endogenous inhibitor of DNA gyrase (YacG/DUF329 family)